MERKAHVSYDFKALSPADKFTFGNNVISKMMVNAGTFDSPPIPMLDLTAATNALNSTYQAYKQNGINSKGAFTEAEAIWDAFFARTADYVDLLADGLVSTINLSGFHITKTETTPAELPDAPKAEIYGGRDKGIVIASADAIKGAKGYYFGMVTNDFVVQITGNQITFKLGDSFATLIIGTQKDVVFENLPSHVDVKAMAAAFNSAGLGARTNVNVVSIP